MFWVALFGPSLILMVVRGKIEPEYYKNYFDWIIQLGVYTFLICVFTESIVTYLLHIDGICQEAFCSFSFFIKYSVIATGVALCIGFIQHIVKKVLKVSIEVGVYHENAKEAKH